MSGNVSERIRYLAWLDGLRVGDEVMLRLPRELGEQRGVLVMHHVAFRTPTGMVDVQLPHEHVRRRFKGGREVASFRYARQLIEPTQERRDEAALQQANRALRAILHELGASLEAHPRTSREIEGITEAIRPHLPVKPK